jgi:hypothetical protein
MNSFNYDLISLIKEAYSKKDLSILERIYLDNSFFYLKFNKKFENEYFIINEGSFIRGKYMKYSNGLTFEAIIRSRKLEVRSTKDFNLLDDTVKIDENSIDYYIQYNEISYIDFQYPSTPYHNSEYKILSHSPSTHLLNRKIVVSPIYSNIKCNSTFLIKKEIKVILERTNGDGYRESESYTIPANSKLEGTLDLSKWIIGFEINPDNDYDPWVFCLEYIPEEIEIIEIIK